MSQAAWILGLHEMSAPDRDELSSLRHHPASFVEQLERIKPCAEARGQNQQLQLPIRIYQPRPDRTIDDCSDERSAALRQKTNSGRARLGIPRMELEDPPGTLCICRHAGERTLIIARGPSKQQSHCVDRRAAVGATHVGRSVAARIRRSTIGRACGSWSATSASGPCCTRRGTERSPRTSACWCG
jgi:hypothetical protein